MGEQSYEVNWTKIFRERRNRIRQAVGDGAILWMGNVLQPRNYSGNTYPFRQNSNFLYITGLSEPNLALLSLPQIDDDTLFSRSPNLDDVIWSGTERSPNEMAQEAGIEKVEDLELLEKHLVKVRDQEMKIHYLPPYQASLLLSVAKFLNVKPSEVGAGASKRLMEEVSKQRSIKSEMEVAEIEEALGITDRMHRAGMAAVRPGVHEHQIAGIIQGIALLNNRQQSYNPIVTIRGEVLHNNSYRNLLQEGQLLLHDSGAESLRYYASDITRTCPVSGRFSERQAEIYQTVLSMQLGAIHMMKPGIDYREVHLTACRIMAEGLKAMGLMKGNPSDAVEAGAHALFFPHGIGHMLGLDVHDMEDLGDIVGYSKGTARSSQFGLNTLRFNRQLEAGLVLTVEPGIYFIPALIDRWQNEGQYREFINYAKVDAFSTFGGIRIEDDVLVTPTAARVLGPHIPKAIPEIEEAMNHEWREFY